MVADVFWDTGGFFALLNADDPGHAVARELLCDQEIKRQRSVTTSWVVGETCTLLVARKRPHMVSRFLDHVQASKALWCVHPDESHFVQTAAFLRKHLDPGLLICGLLEHGDNERNAPANGVYHGSPFLGGWFRNAAVAVSEKQKR